MESATKRRLREELGLQCPLQFLYKFEYQAQFDEAVRGTRAVFGVRGTV